MTFPILVIADTHMPFEHPGYLEFLVNIRDTVKPVEVVHIGDVADMHSVSRFPHDPDGWSAGDEFLELRRHLRQYVREFPRVKVCIGNHDARFLKAAFRAGLPTASLRSFVQVMGTGPGWRWKNFWTFPGVLFEHGSGSSRQICLTRALSFRSSYVMGHTHCWAGVQYHNNGKNTIFALNVGCGINESAYPFQYAREYAHKSVLGCGVVMSASEAYFVPMDQRVPTTGAPGSPAADTQRGTSHSQSQPSRPRRRARGPSRMRPHSRPRRRPRAAR